MMDTKEALKELEDLTVDYGDRNEEQIARLDEAIDMAMDALRNLPNRLRQAMDTISRKDTIEAIQQHFNPTGEELPTELASVLAGVGVVIGTMPSAQPEVLACGEGELIAHPEIIRCKDCKHWKDSDGVYRRGIGAESKCPVNIRAVYEGNFYCADAERRTDG